jgi:hypothetical protein
MQALARRPDLIRRTERITAATLAEQLATSAPPFLLDVRTPREWQNTHIAGSVNIPLNHLQERLNEVPCDRPLVFQHPRTTWPYHVRGSGGRLCCLGSLTACDGNR